MFFCGSFIILLTLFEYGISSSDSHGNKGNEVFIGNFPVWRGGRGVYISEVRESVKKIIFTQGDSNGPHIKTDNKQVLCITNPELLTKKTDTTKTEGTINPELLTEKTDTTTTEAPTTRYVMHKMRGGN